MNRFVIPSLVATLSLSLIATGTARAEEDIRKSVVKIFSSQSPPNMFQPWRITPPSEATGSGVIIDGGRILTNAHVVSYAQQIYVQPYESSNKLDATVEFIAQDCDLAILKLDEPDEIKDLKPVPLAEKLPAPKTKINVLGYPAGGDTISITEGVVSRIEYVPYYFSTAALRIQVDAAINPGNSGGPGIVDDQIAGIVFSKFTEGENIGYLIPAEVVRHFLDDFTSDGKYDGFPRLQVASATLENPDMRAYLKLDKDTTGALIFRVERPDLKGLLEPWDVVLQLEGSNVDNLGMVSIAEGVRVQMGYLISRKPSGSTVQLKLMRHGEVKEVEVSTVTEDNSLIQRMTGDRPTYFIYGGLVFSPLTKEMMQSAGPNYFAYLGYSGALIPQLVRRDRERPDDEIVVSCAPIIPHRLTKGYGVTPLSVLTHVNEQSVRNLRQMIQLIKENKEEFIVFHFENGYEEKIVLDPKRVEQFMPEILANNNIPAACSADLRDLWP